MVLRPLLKQTTVEIVYNLMVSAVGKQLGASTGKVVKRRLKFDFLLSKVFAVDGEVAGMWHVRGPHLNAALALGQRWMPRLLVLRAVGRWAGVDQTKERYLPTGSEHGSAVVSSKVKVIFRTWGALVHLRPPGLGLLQHSQRDHLAC